MRVASQARDVTARADLTAISRGAWVVTAVNITLTLPILIQFTVVRGFDDARIAPIILLSILLGLTLAAAVMPRSWLTGVGWTFAGFTVSTGLSVTVAVITGLPIMMGWGPVLVMLIYVSIYGVLATIQRRQHRLSSDIEELENETVRLAGEENFRLRVTAAVHDTLLNDLSIIMTAPSTLDQRAIDRLRADIQTLTSAEWMREPRQAVIADSDAELRNRIMLLVNELQWRGLTVHVTGGGSGIYTLTESVASALLDAIRACFENALRHSGVPTADVYLAYTATQVTVIVSDEGVGFDPAGIAADRLGVRLSVIDRMHAAGGSARIWSSPGNGTSIVLSAPLIEIVTPAPAPAPAPDSPEGVD